MPVCMIPRLKNINKTGCSPVGDSIAESSTSVNKSIGQYSLFVPDFGLHLDKLARNVYTISSKCINVFLGVYPSCQRRYASTATQSGRTIGEGEYFCMGDLQAKKPNARGLQRSTAGRISIFRSFALAPVPIDDQYRKASMSMQQPSWWQRFTRWIAYYKIQLRWDIERRVARLFNRRWGG